MTTCRECTKTTCPQHPIRVNPLFATLPTGMTLVSPKPHSGDKYRRTIHPLDSGQKPIQVDVYNVLEAFQVTCPAIQHAVKKLLCAGLRGKGDKAQDLQEAKDAIERALVLEKDRQQ